MSTRRVRSSDIGPRTLTGDRAVMTSEWIRNKAWPTLTAPSSAEQKLIGLYAIWPGDSSGTGGNWFAVTVSGAYTVDFGDGTSVNTASGTATYKSYDFSDVDLYDATVTLTDSGDVVTRTAHGYVNGDVVRFYRITSTTGLSEGQAYYVVNATTNTFQVAATADGAAIALTTNGSASLLPYKVATVTITPQAGGDLTSIDLSVKHNQTGLQNYATGWLDIVVSAPNATTLTPSVSGSITNSYLERFNLVNIGAITSLAGAFQNCYVLRVVSFPADAFSAVTNMSGMFQNCLSLTGVPLFNTASVTDMSNMFFDCRSLTNVPLFNTASATNMNSMFNSCYSLTSVPLFNTASVTNMNSMFNNCRSLTSVPLFNTALVTNMGSMFINCFSLTSVPLFDTVSVANMSSMLSGCYSLTSVPLFNTASVTNMSNMFFSCYSLTSVPLFNTALVTNMSTMLSGCYSLTNVPLFNTAAVTNMSGMFNTCQSLTSVPLFNTASVTNMGSMFIGCQSLTSVPALNVSGVQSGNFNGVFTLCRSVSRIQANEFKFTFSVFNCNLSATALNEIYTNLPTVTGQTITVTGNYGVDADDPSIATAKGWTVTG